MFVRAEDDIGDIHKVPFKLEQVPGSLSGDFVMKLSNKYYMYIKIEGNFLYYSQPEESYSPAR